MKRDIICFVAIAVVIALIAFFASDTFGQLTHPGQTKFGNIWVDDSEMAKYNFNVDKYEANAHGDTYCSKCGKITAGKVRICSHCGKYI